MKKLSCLLLAGLLATGCVDSDYDLNDVDTDNVAIGDESSVFRSPLVTIRVGLNELEKNGVDVRALFAEADIWLPTNIPGDYVDMKRLQNDRSYLSELLDALIAEMEVSETKFRDVMGLIYNNADYRREVVASVPGLDAGNEQLFLTTARAAFLSDTAGVRDLFRGVILDLARGNLSSLTLDDLIYDVDRIDLDDEVVDMLVDNLDPEGSPARNTLHLYGNIANNLPLTASLQPRFTPTDITFPVHIDASKQENAISEIPLYADDLRALVDGFRISIPIGLERYYRGGFSGATDATPQLLIQLRLVKRGGLKF